MIICEYEFKNEDPKHKGYSFCEIDFYAWIPGRFHKTERNHRLTLWKNITTGKYELIKVFMNQQVITIGTQGLGIFNTPSGEQYEVVFTNENLQAVLEEAHGLWNKYHKTDDYERQCDEVCQHDGGTMFCFKNKFK
ncbi:MAG: hypothetical protein ACFFG0_18525 [Candidatus Thorarchaeota archaeon]